MINRQLELILAHTGEPDKAFRRGSGPFRTGRRRNRAAWWFARMRQVVDEAQQRHGTPRM